MFSRGAQGSLPFPVLSPDPPHAWHGRGRGSVLGTYMISGKACLYHGVQFRSHLEVRWAIFFDRLEAKWEYEPRLFQTPLGGYLPDFYLPKLKAWVEVKPFEPTTEQLQKLASVKVQTGERALFMCGEPGKWLGKHAIGKYVDGVDYRGRPDLWTEILSEDECISPVLPYSKGGELDFAPAFGLSRLLFNRPSDDIAYALKCANRKRTFDDL